MPLFSKKSVDQHLQKLQKYTQVTLDKPTLLTNLSKALIASKPNWLYESESNLENETLDESSILERVYDILDEDNPSLVFLGSENEGDGNPYVFLYALVDEEAKTYSLFQFFGYYSSWGSANWESIDPIKLNHVECYEPECL